MREARDDPHRWLRRGLPVAVVLTLLLLWEAIVRLNSIPHYILPAPSRVLVTLAAEWNTLAPSLWFTLKLTFVALAAAVVGGVLLAVLLSISRWAELAFLPIAVILQVTPIIAVAPLILIYVESTFLALLICAWIVAFFPILASTIIGLRSADHNLQDLFRLYGATRLQRLSLLLAPSCLPYFLGGLKIAGGLALVGAVAAEFVAGTTGKNTGLASRILEASFRSETPRMFAALVLISICGILIYLSFNLLARRLLAHWHESERDTEH